MAPMATTTAFSETIRLRLRTEDKELIRRAAELVAKASGRRGDVSDFVRVAAIDAAKAALARVSE